MSGDASSAERPEGRYGVQRLYVGGREVDANSGRTFTTLNPATGETLAEVQLANAADVDAAVRAAARAFPVWSGLTGAARGRVLLRAAALLRERRDELARLEVLDTGKPIAEASAVDVDSGADCLDFFGGVAATLHGQYVDLGAGFFYTRREPLGVCAGIGAWNYPLQIACWKAAPALACGNTMVFKPSELTPLTAHRLALILTEAGLPAGAFNVVQGDAPTGQALVRHPGVAKVSLTGEVETGRRVMADAAGTLKHVTMELGGKSPLIVFADADLDNAVSGALLANFYTQGEVCSNGTRVFVERSIHNAFIDRLLARVERMKVGDPLDPETDVGALISEEHMNRVLGYIEAGRQAGARLLCGGARPDDPGLGNGFFVTPAVFDRCDDAMSIVREEIFGPVMSVLTFDAEEEVLRRANDTPYGLSAGVFTRDLARAHRVVARLHAGTCWINSYNVTPVEMPFGGVKQSGLGRENGLAAIDHYSQLKSVYVGLGDVEAPY
ncbi:MAG TPA: betaine-aldehyde dehydrogenase [Geminicoccaceae bacterium]|nr:betaine-aldehyde dehydrogenase [Geminicoccaceae bacterium]